jgi:hypothetical protein
VTAEYALGGTRMDEPLPYSVLVDRISHEVPYYRSSQIRRAAGRARDQQPVYVDSATTVL